MVGTDGAVGVGADEVRTALEASTDRLTELGHLTAARADLHQRAVALTLVPDTHKSINVHIQIYLHHYLL